MCIGEVKPVFSLLFAEECPVRRKSGAQLRNKYAMLTAYFKMRHNKPVHLKYVHIMPLSLSPQFSDTENQSKQPQE
jgi:hypothetical protein